MDTVPTWSRKYPIENEVLPEATSLDAYIAATQTKGSTRSAHAWIIYNRDPFKVAVSIQANVSREGSTEQRGCLSAAVRILQRCASGSDVRIFLRSENVVNAIRGENNLLINHDILDEFEWFKSSKKLHVEVIHCTADDKKHLKIIERLRTAARRARDMALKK